MGLQRDELVALPAHYRISLADIPFLTVRLFFRRQEISLLFNTYIGLYLQLLFLTKYVEIYAAEKTFLSFENVFHCVFIYQTFYSYVKALPAIFLVTVVKVLLYDSYILHRHAVFQIYHTSARKQSTVTYEIKTKFHPSLKMKKNVVRFQTTIDRQPRNSQQMVAAYLSRYKTQKPIVMAQVVALIGLEKFSRSVHLLQ